MADGFSLDHEQGTITYNSNIVHKAYMTVRAVEKTTSVTLANNIIGKTLITFSGTLTNVRAIVDTAGTTGLTTIQIKKNDANVLSTPLSIDSGEDDSVTAATPAVISDSSFSLGDSITFDIVNLPSTPPKGLLVALTFNRTLS